MTRYELIQAFHKMAQILFLGEHSEKEVLIIVKQIVLDVLTENVQDSPLRFTADDKK